jgi:formate hydrogenlyase subunit 6/NADH:ubiquinone oxidoreductase subunit I
MRTGQSFVIESENLEQLFKALNHRGYEVIGPAVGEGAITYQPLTSIKDLPEGWSDEQQGGQYRLKRRSDRAWFGYVIGPHSWKQFLHPPALRLWQAERKPKGFRWLKIDAAKAKYAFVGVRACELHAIAVQDQIFLQGPSVDANYKARRENVFIVAVNCGQAGGSCFCASMNTGPKATFGYDLALTELLQHDGHRFVVQVGTARGAEILSEITHGSCEDSDAQTADSIVNATAEHMGRSLEMRGIQELLYRNGESPQWDNVAARCLSCANCTMVCPTCFCTTVEDVTDLSGSRAERWRKWDSCFTVDFSYIHGGSVRATVKSRYRQWMTHKLATWTDQFGKAGCVGCGRCITWCPVGIDITAEVRSLRENDAGNGASDSSRSPA